MTSSVYIFLTPSAPTLPQLVRAIICFWVNFYHLISVRKSFKDDFKGRGGAGDRHDADDLVCHSEASHADAHLQGHRGGARTDRQLLPRLLPRCLRLHHGERPQYQIVTCRNFHIHHFVSAHILAALSLHFGRRVSPRQFQDIRRGPAKFIDSSRASMKRII